MVWPTLRKDCPKLKSEPPWVLECSDLRIKDLKYIEALEDLMDFVRKVADQRSYIEGILKIGNKMARASQNKALSVCVSEGLNWIRSTGVVKIYKKIEELQEYSIILLQTFFTNYAHYIMWMAKERTTIVSWFRSTLCSACAGESECMKQCGNEEFSKGHYSLACELYSKAIEYYPDNHLLFGNRALCFIRMGKYKKALSDGKKAIVLKNNWPKGHYRFCEALFLLGDPVLAVESNEKAQELCEDSPEGIKDLLQQHAKIKKHMEDMKEQKPKKSFTKKLREGKLAAQFNSVPDSTEKNTVNSGAKEEVHHKDPVNGKNVETKESSSNNVPGHQPKKAKSKAVKVSRTDPKENEKDISCGFSKKDLMVTQEMVKSLVNDGYTALKEQRFHNAQGAFSRLLEMLDPMDLKRINLTNIDYVVLLYGHANALLGIGQSQELMYAENELKKITQHYTKERFNCVAFFGIGNVYYRQNRFSDALNQYVKSKTMIKHKIVSGILSWPTTSVVLEETRPETLKLLLENRIEECKFPPKPDALCRYEQCLNLPKTQIYFTDPDFKGFIRIVCCQFCRVEFHIMCWKKLKANMYADKNDKDFLKSPCITPDCQGNISSVVILDSTGLVKCEFVDKTIKKREPQRTPVKQKGPCNKKAKFKQECKLEGKKLSPEASKNWLKNENPEDVEIKSMKIDFFSYESNYCMSYGEIMLKCIKENEDLFKHGMVDTKEFLAAIVSWRFMSQEEQDALHFESCKSPCEEMQLILNHLYKLKNRVKTRIFLFLLELCGANVALDLLGWIILFNETGLDAATDFHDRAQEYLANINLESLMSLWNETYGNNLNFFISDVQTQEILNCFNEASPEIIRCFIWFLDENKEKLASDDLDVILAIYFESMDIPYNLVCRSPKEGRSTKGMKVKNKHKKKKQNPLKLVYKLSGGVSTRSQDEDFLSDENTLDFLDPNEPFIIPEYLRHQVEEFEALPVGSRFQRPPDNNADPIRETLFEYFSQILEEHGPLPLDDEILVGEYKGFPEETHRLVEEAGGLKDFLLESGRFIMVGNLLGLIKHLPLLEDDTNKYTLNPAAKEFKPSCSKPFNSPIINSLGICSNDRQTTNMPYSFSSAPLLAGSSLFLSRNPNNTYLLPTYPPGFDPAILGPLFTHNPGIGLHPPTVNHGVYNVSIDEATASDFCTADKQDELECPESPSMPDDDVSSSSVCKASDISPEFQRPQTAPMKKSVQTAIVSVQVDIEFSAHEVNTNPFHPFETQQGDILRMEKEHQVLNDQLKEATEKYEHMLSRYNEEYNGLKKQVDDISAKNKIAIKEFEWLSQYLDNEAKKWQQEKKEKQDNLKALKSSIKSVTNTNERYLRNIEEKQKKYKRYLDDFLQISFPKFENEKAKIEKHTKKCQDDLQYVMKRAITAEANVLENQKQSELLKLKVIASRAEQSVNVLKQVVLRSTSKGQDLQEVRNLESVLSVLNKETEKLEAQFDEKIKLVKNGTKLGTLGDIQVNFQDIRNIPPLLPLQPQPAPHISKMFTSYQPNSPSIHSNPLPQLSVSSPTKKTVSSKTAIPMESDRKPIPSVVDAKLPAPVQPKVQKPIGQERKQNMLLEGRQPSPAKQTMFDRIIEELQDIFPHYKSGELALFIKDLRSKTGGTLAGMKHEDIISRVIEHILDMQTKSLVPASHDRNSAWGYTPQPGAATAPTAPKPDVHSSPTLAETKKPWRVVTGASKKKWQKSDESETYNDEPCIICHDELSLYQVHTLDCGHHFHKHCIKTWLNTQSTCPTCRDHALLPEDFPALSGRMRTA
ncbi:E3 ubiquitin-protein ligase TTC3 [Bombina bombina]|uniref:E3 ubiquitin-protein ligase TTC3 n=1 Tax=Bombina bombina TaxID=8345 RepID=UPI00235AB4E7|nr:E3 ubiquitin-protein ligase TTC3 [Bombina bombina]